MKSGSVLKGFDNTVQSGYPNSVIRRHLLTGPANYWEQSDPKGPRTHIIGF